MRLRNAETIELAIGSARVPEYITDYRNYLVHPSARTRAKYDRLLARLGMLQVKPEELPRQEQAPGLPLFTSWIREAPESSGCISQLKDALCPGFTRLQQVLETTFLVKSYTN